MGGVPGGIAKAFGLDDGPAHGKGAIVKRQALGDATPSLNTCRPIIGITAVK